MNEKQLGQASTWDKMKYPKISSFIKGVTREELPNELGDPYFSSIGENLSYQVGKIVNKSVKAIIGVFK